MHCTVTAEYYSKYFFKKIMLYCITKNCRVLQKNPNLVAEKHVDTSRCLMGKPNSCNQHIYHFHVLESPHLDFSKLWGIGGNY